MNKLNKIIEKLDHKELLLIQKDLDSGNIEKLISKKLQQYRENKHKTCPSCGRTFSKTYGTTIEFGPPDLRQTASFDANDCLQHFINNNLNKPGGTTTK